MRSFSYAFEELPLVISGGYAACDVTGFAEITYDMTGAWSVQRMAAACIGVIRGGRFCAI